MSGIPSWAVKGANVVCVKPQTEIDRLSDSWAGKWSWPVSRGIYTIRSIFQMPAGGYIVRLVEVRNPVATFCDGRYEPGFTIRAFRPLVTRSLEQDVALFAHNLAGKRREIADA